MNIAHIVAGLPKGWRVAHLEPRFLARVWAHLVRAKSPWATRVLPSKEALLRTLEKAVLLLETPWGLFYFTNYAPGWRLIVHGLFWGKGAWGALRETRETLNLVMSASCVCRVECPVLGRARGVERFLTGAGFTREGFLKCGEIDESGEIVDKTLYGVVR